MMFKWWNAKQVHRFHIQLDSVCFTVNFVFDHSKYQIREIL